MTRRPLLSLVLLTVFHFVFRNSCNETFDENTLKGNLFFPLFNTSVLQLWRGSLFSVLFQKWKEKKNGRLSLASYNCL